MEPNTLLESALRDWGRLQDIATQILTSLTHEQWTSLPPKEWWTAAQAIQHLVMSAGPYIDAFKAMEVPEGSRPWKPTFVGKMLVRYAGPNPPFMVPAPKSLDPSTESDEQVLSPFLAQFDPVRSAFESFRGKDLNHKFRSPVAEIVKLNLGDAVLLIVGHTERHLRQAVRCAGQTWPA